MRFESDGQIVIDSIAPRNATDLFTVIANPTQKSAINAYSTTGTGFYTKGGRYGLFAQVDTAVQPTVGTAVFARNYDALGYGSISVGSNISSFVFITSHTAGVTSYGVDGLHAWGRDATGYGIFAIGSAGVAPFNLSGVSAGLSAVGNYGIIAKGSAATGRGIVAIGSAIAAPSTSNESEGGAFTGYHGIYARGTGSVAPTFGIGVIGVGYNASSYSTLSGVGLGGSFTGNYGIYGKGISSDGVGVLGVGSNGSGYYTVTGGSGGAFTGYHGSLSVGVDPTLGTGVIGAGNNGSYIILPAGSGGSFTGTTTGTAGFGTSATAGIGVIGVGNNQSAWVPSNGAGGAFTGNTGVFCRSTNATGTGIVSTGNNLAAPGTYANGAGGSFTGTEAGSVAWGTTAATGIGVIGAGNNVAITTPATGAGGAFTGSVCGVYGYATNTANDRYGAYFAIAGSPVYYAYVGGRYSGTNRKIVGNGTVSTIVKNTRGEIVTLVCPEAPESLFQDYGVGQLVDGFAHITIDPDLAINITVSPEHPLKVFITPEGDCLGVYVTNKSANGFDVVELQGGRSDISFSWQIVATRANEEYVMKDGTIEVSDYSKRFQTAPGPLENAGQNTSVNPSTPENYYPLEKITSGRDNYNSDQTHISDELKVKEDEVMENKDNMDE
jgi:hypothetical protein